LFHTLKEDGHFDGGFLDKNLILFCFIVLIQVGNMNVIQSSIPIWLINLKIK
jgi:hypothetical protein